MEEDLIIEKKEVKQEDCEICLLNKKKYKCPKCQIKYCGVNCFKKHQCTQKLMKTPEKQFENIAPKDEDIILEDESKVPEHRFQLLKSSTKIKKILENKRLRELITKIDGSRYSQKLRILNERLKADTNFFEFVQLMLKEMGYIEVNGKFETNPK